MVTAINHGIAAEREIDLRSQDIGEAIDVAIAQTVKRSKVMWIERRDGRGSADTQNTTRRAMLLRRMTKR